MFGKSSTDQPVPGMVSMLASMLGITPSDLMATVTEFQSQLMSVVQTQARIEGKLDLLLIKEGLEYNGRRSGDGTNGDGGDRAIGSDGNSTS